MGLLQPKESQILVQYSLFTYQQHEQNIRNHPAASGGAEILFEMLN